MGGWEDGPVDAKGGVDEAVCSLGLFWVGGWVGGVVEEVGEIEEV